MQIIRVATALAFVAVTVFLPIGAPAADMRSDNDVVVVEVNGTHLTLVDLEQKRAPALFQARATYYDTERKVVEDFVDEYLLEQQAKKEGITVSELLDRHVTATLPKDPTDEALRVYYEGVETTEPYEVVRDKIIESLHQRRTAKARSTYLQSLRSASSIIIHLAPPRAPISMKDVPMRGTSNPPVTIVEFADFECPYCQQMEPMLGKLETEFKGKVALAYKDYPLPMHPDAQKAAEAAHCAGAQGKYWEYHDVLFAKKQLDIPALKNFASDLKLDPKAFETCLDSGQMATVVKEQATEAQALGVQGTPTILINGRSISGTLTYDRIRAVISEELSAVKAEVSPARSAERGAVQGQRLN